MTIPEAIDLAIKALREKADVERVQLHMVERAPAIARQIDPHATRRYQKYTDAITLLTGLKKEPPGQDQATEPKAGEE